MKRVQCFPTYEQLEKLTQDQLFNLMLSTSMIHTGPKPNRETLLAQFAHKLKFNHPIYKHV
jgi:hypothetical protein